MLLLYTRESKVSSRSSAADSRRMVDTTIVGISGASSFGTFGIVPLRRKTFWFVSGLYKRQRRHAP